MFRFTLSILFALSGATLYYLFLYAVHKHQDMILNHKIRIYNGYYITINDEENNGKNVLFHNKNQMDIVKGLREKISGWYLITGQGYYIFSRFNRKIIFVEDINSQKSKVKEIFSDVEESIVTDNHMMEGIG